MIITYYLGQIAYGLYSPMKMSWVYLMCQLGMSIMQAFYWLTPPFIIQILLENFNTRCYSDRKILFEDYKQILEIFAFFSNSFKTFLLVYFTFNQIYFVLYSFSTLSISMITDHFSEEGALMAVLAIWGQVMSAIFAFDIFTGEIENSFEKLKGLKTPIQERLLQCPGEVEKAQMNYLLQKIEDVKPMNACGYFEIGKSTLTSMLSVRLGKYSVFHLIWTQEWGYCEVDLGLLRSQRASM